MTKTCSYLHSYLVYESILFDFYYYYFFLLEAANQDAINLLPVVEN